MQLMHISYRKELVLTAATKLTLILLQVEWPQTLRDQAHDPQPP